MLHHNREQMRGEMSMDGIYATLPYFQATKLLLACHLNHFVDGVHMSGSTVQLIIHGL
jgi:hypothetical protein